MASWYVTLSTDVIQSPLVQVQPGDSIRGIMQKSGNASTWFVNTIDVTAGKNTSFTVSRALLEAPPWAYVALEVYNIEQCSDFPPQGSTVPTPTWSCSSTTSTPPSTGWWAGTDRGRPCAARASTRSSPRARSTSSSRFNDHVTM